MTIAVSFGRFTPEGSSYDLSSRTLLAANDLSRPLRRRRWSPSIPTDTDTLIARGTGT